MINPKTAPKIDAVKAEIRRLPRSGSLFDYERGKRILEEYSLTGGEYYELVRYLSWWVKV